MHLHHHHQRHLHFHHLYHQHHGHRHQELLLAFVLLLCTQSILATNNVKDGSSGFIILPQNQTAVQGDSVDFHCQIPALGNLIYFWFLNGVPVRNSVRIQQNGSNLHIDSVQWETDSGMYVCVAMNVITRARLSTTASHLSIVWIATANVRLLSANRHQIMLKCYVKGSSAVGHNMEVEWFRNSEKLSTLQNIELNGYRLIIRHPSTKDDGLYRCVATNLAGRVISQHGYPLKWSNIKGDQCSPKHYRLGRRHLHSGNSRNALLCRDKREDATRNPLVVNENESAALTCIRNASIANHFQTLHQIPIRWRKDGKTIRQTVLGVNGMGSTAYNTNESLEGIIRDDSHIFINPRNGKLVFNSVSSSDAGIYVCEVFVGEPLNLNVSEIRELQVIERLKFAPQPTSKNLELGLVGKVHCKAQGTPTPKIKWLKNMGEHLPNTVEDINGTLTFKNVTIEHRGNYTCIASNRQGEISATVSINVVVAPRFSLAPQGQLEIVESAEAIIHCQAIGNPKPTIQWDKDLKYLSENNTDSKRFEFFDNGTLFIKHIQMKDEGTYGCTIGNSAGLKREEIRLMVKDADGFLITRAILLTMSVALAYIVLVITLMIWCRFRRKARKAHLQCYGSNDLDNPEIDESNKNAENEPCLPNTTIMQKTFKTNSCNNLSATSKDSRIADDTNSKYGIDHDDYNISRKDIKEMIQIGRGEFGDVFIGKIEKKLIEHHLNKPNKNDQRLSHSKSSDSNSGSNSSTNKLTPSTSSTQNNKASSKTCIDEIEEVNAQTAENGIEYELVMVKALNKFKDEQLCQEFKRQLEVFRTVTSKGVVRLLGMCKEKDPHYMILEYTDWGDLKQFLLTTAGKVNTPQNATSPPALQVAQVLAVAYQVARGMDAIYKARLIHKDLATRNCLISSDFVIKISYPSLSQDKYQKEYSKHNNCLLPIRWMAPESIQDNDYTTKSDVFSFAVLVWELFLQATKIPFEDLTDEEVIAKSQAGSLEWQCAADTPNSVTEILMSCWHLDPKERPSFNQISTAFTKAMQQLDK